jgi:hypothetical protein
VIETHAAAPDHRCKLRYDPRLVEEAVVGAVSGLPRAEQRTFHTERERAYSIEGDEDREDAFKSVFQRWFRSLRLGEPLARTLREFPDIAGTIPECRVIEAASERDEAADLLDLGPRTAPTLVVRVRPQAFIDGVWLAGFLRHELTHVHDMLDPVFGYERALPGSDLDPAYRNILRSRYSVVWDASIDGRLARAGYLDDSARERRRREFRAAFPMLEDQLDRVFARWFDGPAPTHLDIVSFVAHPTNPEAFNAHVA